jgi:hypothetical protein
MGELLIVVHEPSYSTTILRQSLPGFGHDRLVYDKSFSEFLAIYCD